MPHREALLKHIGLEHLTHQMRDVVSHFKEGEYGIYEIKTVPTDNKAVADNRPIIISGICFLMMDKELIPVGFRASNFDTNVSSRTDTLDHWVAWQPISPSHIQKEMDLTPIETERLARTFCHGLGVDFDRNLSIERRKNGAELFIKDIFGFYEGRVKKIAQNIREDEDLRNSYRRAIHEQIKYALENAYPQARS